MGKNKLECLLLAGFLVSTVLGSEAKVEHPTVCHSKGRLLTLLIYIKLSQKKLSVGPGKSY